MKIKQVLISMIGCILSLAFVQNIVHADESTDTRNERMTAEEFHEHQLQNLNDLGIDCVFNEYSQIELVDKSPESIEKTNKMLSERSKLNTDRGPAYPTAYMPLYEDNTTTVNQDFIVSRQTFHTIFTNLMKKGEWLSPAQISIVAVAAYGATYVMNRDLDFLYSQITYNIRENSAGYIDFTGVWIGDYTLRKQVFQSNNSSFISGKREYFYHDQSIPTPLF